MPALRQTAWATVPSDRQGTCWVTLDQPTQAGSLVVVVAASIHDQDVDWQLYGPSGFTQAFLRVADRITVAVWYRLAAPAMSVIGVASPGDDTLQVRVLEYVGVAQSAALDKLVVVPGGGYSPATPSTGTTAQADELVIGVLANRHQSTSQSGFSGGLTKLTENASASQSGSSSIEDGRRSRMTVHQAIQTSVQAWSFAAALSAPRDWVIAVLTFRGGTFGPARMTALAGPPLITIGGRADLTVFGPLKATTGPRLITIGGSARIGPSELQMRLGGWTGLLIGPGTPYRIESVEGLGGMDMRISDGDIARGDGAQRGIDLQAARQILLSLNWDDPDTRVMEDLTVDLAAALVPQRSEDWPLLFRLPGQPLQQVFCRPVQLAREINLMQMLLRSQKVALRAADPRIYSAREIVVQVPVTPAGQAAPAAVAAVNAGNGRAYPLIAISNRGSVAVTGIELVNATAACSFEVNTLIPPGSQLVGDMPARITEQPVSVITLDGQTKYGAWLPPRAPFYLAPDPIAPAGANALYLRTTPPGADVVATVTYRDTSHG